MNDNMRRFLDAISTDIEWVASQKDLSQEESIASAIKKSAEIGIPLTEADFTPPEGELSEEELTAVAGAGNCYCMMGGGGTKENPEDKTCQMSGNVDQVCWCVVYGEGWRDVYDFNGDWHDDEQRCECPMMGNGY